MTTKDARTHHRQLRDLWEDEDPPSNWRPRISSTELQHLVSELFVFHRAAAVTLHRRDGDPVHLDIEHPYGVNAYGGLYRRLQQRMSERSGFTYAVRPYPPEVFRELRWSGADLVCPAWDDHASPLKR